VETFRYVVKVHLKVYKGKQFGLLKSECSTFTEWRGDKVCVSGRWV